MSSDNLVSMRVNSSLLPRFVGKTVRLTCRPIKLTAAGWTVQASDGGEVTVTLLSDQLTTDTYFEVIGSVASGTSIKMFRSMNLGNDLDMTLVNDTINLMHDPRFYNKIFCE
ncbi:replication factor A protein 3 [Mycena alexandri]|uniref:Replication factor A protein 3 n=1 Tax=Mycena alexandri TaxID=1745969 RepID=A0AAD6TK35_9AGAR|nr:replication factor A protein 3 [Mycena alexandri]